MMEKKEQENKTMQPLSEAELEQVQGGLSSHRPALGPYDRECGNEALGEILWISGYSRLVRIMNKALRVCT